MASCHRAWWTELKGGDPRTDQARKGTTRTPGWHPRRESDLTATKRGTLEPAWVLPKSKEAQIFLAPRTLASRRHWLLQVVAANCWRDVGGRSHASACSSPSSHSWTSPSRTLPSGTRYGLAKSMLRLGGVGPAADQIVELSAIVPAGLECDADDSSVMLRRESRQ